jgi:OmpA-OmpF porin, OOP family
MKLTNSKIISSVTFFLFGIFSSSILAQDVKSDVKSDVNKWSFEFGLGTNKAIRPFGTGYSSSEKEFYNLQNLNHFDFGLRYMMNSKFGIKSDIAFDQITNTPDNGSLPFNSLQYRIGFQGVVNLGRVFDFNTFTNTIGLLGHGGIQLSQFKAKTGLNGQEAVTESNRGFVLGITPQIKLSEWTILTTDFSVLTNLRQRLNWDGSVSAKENNLSGVLYSTTIGLTFYLGKNEHHSDWFVPQNSSDIITNSALKLDPAQTPPNTSVEKTTLTDQKDSQSIPNSIAEAIGTDSKVVEKLDNLSIKYLLENGLLNVFYEVNEDEPKSSSTNSVFGIISLLKNNPTVNVKLLGYADRLGTEKVNKALSERRAKKLFDLLVLSGISDSRLKIIGMGVDNSIPSNSKTALELARRVSVMLD